MFLLPFCCCMNPQESRLLRPLLSLFRSKPDSFSQSSPPRIALLLAGSSGVYDEAEIIVTVSTLIHLSRAGASVQAFSPDKNIMHTIDHLTTKEEEPPRNCMVESARIMRSKVASLETCKASDFDALICRGGLGVANNFAVAGEKMVVDPTVKSVLVEFYQDKKVLGLCCIAPVLASKLFEGEQVTVGSDTESGSRIHASTIQSIEIMGGKHIEKEQDQVVVDASKRIVTAPAYMYAGQPHQIDDSVKAMVDTVLKLVDKSK